MKVTATHWINIDGVWFRPGEIYDDGTPERAEIAVEAPAATEEEKSKEEPVAERPKRGKKRTT